jgi:glutathione S-transferase
MQLADEQPGASSSAPAREPILHHYDRSPFSEKVRLIFGLKRLVWRSVVQPMVLPKPDLAPLTGGFRRIPVLQLGAEVYCDTNLIAAELDRRFPDPPLFGPPSEAAMGAILAQWADRILFLPTARYVTAVNADVLPEAFHADRAAMRGEPAPDLGRLRAAAPHHLAQLQALLGQVEGLLGDGRAFLLGAAPRLADFAVYARIWWLGALGGEMREIEPFGRLRNWLARVRALGHGARREMRPDEALAAAAAAQPSLPPGRGARLRIVTEGQPSDPIEGELAYSSADRVGLRRRDPRLGELIVHFPRLGYEIAEAPA